MTAKTVNYTAEQTAAVVEAFKAGTAVEAIALQVGKTTRSVIAKLSKEGVYTTKAKTAGKAKAATKLEILAKVEVALGMEAGALATFEKGSKEAVEALMAAVANDFTAE